MNPRQTARAGIINLSSKLLFKKEGPQQPWWSYSLNLHWELALCRAMNGLQKIYFTKILCYRDESWPTVQTATFLNPTLLYTAAILSISLSTWLSMVELLMSAILKSLMTLLMSSTFNVLKLRLLLLLRLFHSKLSLFSFSFHRYLTITIFQMFSLPILSPPFILHADFSQ